MSIQVIATERCHDGAKFIEVGETFSVPDDTFDTERVIFDEFGRIVEDAKGKAQCHPLPTGYKPVDESILKPKTAKAAKPAPAKAEIDLA